MDTLGRVLCLWEDDGPVNLQPGDEGKLDTAVLEFLREGRDSLLYLTSLSGEVYVTRASNVCGWIISTPETRTRAVELESIAREENRRNREAFGLPVESDGEEWKLR